MVMLGRTRRIALAALPLTLVLAACSSSAGATSAPASVAAQPSAAAPSTAASEAASSGASAATSGATVEAKSVGSIGTALVAGSNGMTVYTFAKDVKDSGKSACNAGCIDKWPALTVAAGTTPSAGAGVTGKLGTITRDDGTTQVTYNGLPLYFFANDHAPGDANGVYTNWSAVKP
jgi:predicted lipoprotein with Yx(FWY)xxD motif